jgi:hypothetical protein
MFEIDMAHCPNCGGELKIIAPILEQPVIDEALLAFIARRKGSFTDSNV